MTKRIARGWQVVLVMMGMLEGVVGVEVVLSMTGVRYGSIGIVNHASKGSCGAGQQ